MTLRLEHVIGQARCPLAGITLFRESALKPSSPALSVRNWGIQGLELLVLETEKNADLSANLCSANVYF